jgi:hypothetical protein
MLLISRGLEFWRTTTRKSIVGDEYQRVYQNLFGLPGFAWSEDWSFDVLKENTGDTRDDKIANAASPSSFFPTPEILRLLPRAFSTTCQR